MKPPLRKGNLVLDGSPFTCSTRTLLDGFPEPLQDSCFRREEWYIRWQGKIKSRNRLRRRRVTFVLARLVDYQPSSLPAPPNFFVLPHSRSNMPLALQLPPSYPSSRELTKEIQKVKPKLKLRRLIDRANGAELRREFTTRAMATSNRIFALSVTQRSTSLKPSRSKKVWMRERERFYPRPS